MDIRYCGSGWTSSAVSSQLAFRTIAALTIGITACAPSEGETDGNGRAVESGTATAFATPRDADVLVAPLTWQDGTPTVGAPTNLTQRPGYDNQPFFTPDGSGLWYTAVDDHDGQADIWRYDFAAGNVARVTSSNPESEYSATPLPDGSGISVIRVEADSTQRLWRFDADGSNPSVLLADLAPVGYHAWSGDDTLVMFVLGDPPTLQRGTTTSGETEVITDDIGRSIQPIPGSGDVSFVQLHDDDTSTIMRLPAGGGPPVPIIESVDGADDHAWAPDGTLFQATGAVLWALSPGGSDWTEVADFSDLSISLSRLAVSPDGDQIAMVAEVAALDLGTP